MAIRVLKFGGSSLADIDLLQSVAKRVSQLHHKGDKIVLVVSAMGSSTNDLISLALQLSPSPQRRELDMLISSGERVAMSLMSIALNEIGCPAISFTGSQAGVLTDASHTGANIVAVKAFRVSEALDLGKLVVLAGFQGVCPETKEITTLGRGGTDTTAVAMAEYLKADSCEMFKEFEGIYQADPKLVPKAKALNELSYDQLIEICQAGAKVVHIKAVEYAKRAGVPLRIKKAHPFTDQFTQVDANTKYQGKCFAMNINSNVIEIKLEDEKLSEDFFNDMQNLKNQNNKSDIFVIDLQKNSNSQVICYLRSNQSNLDILQVDLLKKYPKLNFSSANLFEINLCFTEKPEDVDLDKSLFLKKSQYGKTLSFICEKQQRDRLQSELAKYLS